MCHKRFTRQPLFAFIVSTSVILTSENVLEKLHWLKITNDQKTFLKISEN